MSGSTTNPVLLPNAESPDVSLRGCGRKSVCLPQSGSSARERAEAQSSPGWLLAQFH